ncbi:hypothetical protein POPTR_010G229351v4 [Populus trichocarpa]|uniref:Uncharacterized protein n=1 Tax=Populus trichocarpa TaxID=3694 RepID=A0ACC0SF24_POPTR|nr:hypothetical protein BDE02_10G205600 [Populus trichocarpa]KAI9387843.1 hypothetical protein POPTR_010G229351v4 [Populus trichocarpa]
MRIRKSFACLNHGFWGWFWILTCLAQPINNGSSRQELADPLCIDSLPTCSRILLMEVKKIQ